MDMQKFFADVQIDPSLGERQIRVIANSGKSDRVNDVLVAAGCKTENYVKNPIVLADHDRSKPIGNFAPEIKDGAVVGVITFAPHGISAKADEYCGLYKSGVMKSVSVGFRPMKFEPVDKNEPYGGLRFDEWELLELSCVSVPCDAEAVVTQRAMPEGRAAQWKCGASLNLPISINSDPWDAEAAAKSIFDHCGFGGDKPDLGLARKGFLVYDSANPADKASYRFPFAKVIDGRLMAAFEDDLPTSEESGIPADVLTKAESVFDHYFCRNLDDLKSEREAIIAEFRAMPTEELRVVKALSAANMEHVKGLAKCMAAMGDLHVKAADNHDAARGILGELDKCKAAADEHMKSLRAAGRKKPKPDAGDNGADDPDADTGDDNDDPDAELAYEAERVKSAAARARQIEIARRA